MPEPSKNEDDLDLALPSLDGEAADEEEDNLLADGEDVGFGIHDDGEPVDLDTSVGFDHHYDDWEIYTFAETGENSALFSDEEVKDFAYHAEAELIAGQEDGWLDDSEPMEQEAWENDELIVETVQMSEEDSGEEGVDEEHVVGGSDDETTLPPLDRANEIESEDDDENDSFGRCILEEVADPRLIESEDE
jgi:hypothetical protein